MTWDGTGLMMAYTYPHRNRTSLAMNRKNTLFSGHDAGAANWGVIALLIETCKLNAVEPHAYFRRCSMS